MAPRLRRQDSAGLRGLGRAVLALLALALAPAAAIADAPIAVSPPPGPRPIVVVASVYLLNLVSVDDREETFDADLYLDLSWRDPRLAFEPSAGEPPTRIYQGDAAASELGEIWWPDLEFVNAASPELTNQEITILADGTVRYRIGLSATFRTSLDLHRFPFDEQRLGVRLQSFEGDTSLVVFEPDHRRLGFNRDDDYAGLEILSVAASTRTTSVEGWDENFSELVFEILVRRSPTFYIWTVFVPVTLVLLLSCTIFFVDIEGFHDRVAIALACFLACVATQFAMSFNLPRISYLTPVDRLFLLAYGCMSLGVAVSVWQKTSLRNAPETLERTDRIAALAIPALYAAGIVFVVLP